MHQLNSSLSRPYLKRGTDIFRPLIHENDFIPGDLEKQIEAFIDHYNYNRDHESLKNLTPADVYFGRGQQTLEHRERIKLKTIEQRRLQFRKQAASLNTTDEPDTLLF